MTENKRIEVKLNNGDRLVAEIDPDSEHNEIFVGVVDKDDNWIQDLAIVTQNYFLKEQFGVPDFENVEDQYSVLVYEDEYDDSPTKEFIINRYRGE